MTEERTILIKYGPRVEREELDHAAKTVESIKGGAVEYGNWSQDQLEAEYRRIWHDAALAIYHSTDLQSIWLVLVQKYNCTSADLARLRSQK